MQEEEIQAIKEGFEAKYPQITMNYFFAGTNKVLTKLATEMQSGEISADLVWTGAPSDYRKLKENRYLSPYISPQAININEAFMDEHHYYIGGRLMSAVIAYNTDLGRSAGSQMERADRDDGPGQLRQHQILRRRADEFPCLRNGVF